MDLTILYFLIGLIAMLLVALIVFISTLKSQFDRMEARGNKDVLDALTSRIREADDSSRKSFQQLAGSLGQLATKSDQIITEFQTIKKFEDLLKPPKLRGSMGETLLEELLSQILPSKFFAFQYAFKSNEKVDAVIFLGNSLVPVDAQFPLEQFIRLQSVEDEKNRASERKAFIRVIKSHIDDIADKYILPDEGTYDFALMYIPAENVYYETIIKDDQEGGLFPYALERCVIPVSPNSFYAYLQVIVRGLRGLKIEEKASEIMNQLSRLRIDEEKFKKDFETLGSHLTNARNKYDEASRKLSRFEDKLLETGDIHSPPSLHN